MNKSEVYQYQDIVIRYVCLRVGVPEAGIVEHKDLLQAIEKANPHVYALMVACFEAYQAWVCFSDEIIAEKKSDKLSETDFLQLRALIAERDKTWKFLTEEINLIRPS